MAAIAARSASSPPRGFSSTGTIPAEASPSTQAAAALAVGSISPIRPSALACGRSRAPSTAALASSRR